MLYKYFFKNVFLLNRKMFEIWTIYVAIFKKIFEQHSNLTILFYERV